MAVVFVFIPIIVFIGVFISLTIKEIDYHRNKNTMVNIPYYIEDEITAIYEQIRVYNQTINYLSDELEYTYNLEKKLKLEKKIVDLKYKVSKLESKVNKLLDKWKG